jgi:hypothetical protein
MKGEKKNERRYGNGAQPYIDPGSGICKGAGCQDFAILSHILQYISSNSGVIAPELAEGYPISTETLLSQLSFTHFEEHRPPGYGIYRCGKVSNPNSQPGQTHCKTPQKSKRLTRKLKSYL